MDDDNDFNNEFEVEHKTAFEGKTESYRMNLSIIKMTDDVIKDGLQTVFEKVKEVLRRRLEKLPKHSRIIATINVEGAMNEYDYTVFALNAFIKLQPREPKADMAEYVKKRVQEAQQKIQTKYSDYSKQNKGDKHLLYLYLQIHKFTDVQSNDSSIEKSLFEIKELEKDSKKIDLGDIVYPVLMDDIPSIAEKNNISINVYMSKQEGVIEGPVYYKMKKKKEKRKNINLLWSCESEHDHFSSEPGINTNRCDGCLNFFDNEKYLELHKSECLRVKTSIPQAKTIQFDNKDRAKKAPFVVYADIETAVSKTLYQNKLTSKDMPNKNWTRNIKKHVPYRYGYYIKCDDEDFSLPFKTDVNPNLEHIVSKFTENLVKDLMTQITKYKNKNPEASIKTVPVLMHNFKSENSCFIVQGSNCQSMYKNYSAIHKIVKSDVGDIQLRFLESRGFLDESLEESIKNMKIVFKEIEKMCSDIRTDDSKDIKETVIGAGGFPFPREYIESPESLRENRFPDLPTTNDDALIYKAMTDTQKQNGRKIWQKIGCRNINDYLELRLKANVLFLADIIEYLRQLCISNYELDLAYYYSIAGLSWDAMLKSTNITLQLLPDVEMLLFIKKAIRGGYIQCSKRMATANNERMLEYDPKKDKSNLMFYDANNLYGHVMCQNLPYGGFEWVDTNVNYKVGEHSDVGYILEVDIDYPDFLHDLHSDFPFFPIKKNVDGNNYKLLVADLGKRKRYVVHYLYLQLLEEQFNEQLKAKKLSKPPKLITKIHRILKFNQKPWLREYIKNNIEKRKMAKATKKDTEEKLFKLLNNCIYGKTMQNVENQGDILLLDNWEDSDNRRGAAHYVLRPDFHSLSICSENMVAIKLHHTNLIFKYPIYVGFCILDLSKAVVYNFHYNVMKKTFKNNITLLYTDTDSLFYEFKGDSYKLLDGKEIEKYFDVEEYANGNYDKLYSCCFKDDMGGQLTKKFVGLKSKMYAIRAESEDKKDKEKMKSPHLPSYVKDKLSLKDYVQCLRSNTPLYKEYNRVRALDHDLYSQNVKRVVISPVEKKRKILDNNIDTLPYHHKLLPRPRPKPRGGVRRGRCGPPPTASGYKRPRAS
ncbi:unnamed protein product [Chilo suppressalis]|uniref:DNA-directed DNA polymerase n=1 Tax=Chilo suppressalis TaxID=168631 RepID=A0ABN8LAA0_CHISP|nr:unnamed protein product [Chilo suppressalis]